MARPLRIQFAGAVYHVISRGNARQCVFADDEDYRCFLRVLKHVATRLNWQVWTYCVMPNHYHLLFETPEPNLARGMRDVNGLYSQLFNARHDRVGHVFQSRYKSIMVDRDSYVLELARYIVLNPVRAQLCEAVEAWRWSSYNSLLGRPDPVMSRANTFTLLRFFTGDADRARVQYRDFVASGVGKPLQLRPGPNRSIAGDESFVSEAAIHVTTPVAPEVSRPDRVLRSLAQFQRASPDRNTAMRSAYASGAFSIKAIADHFGLHSTSVSRIINAAAVTAQPMLEFKT